MRLNICVQTFLCSRILTYLLDSFLSSLPYFIHPEKPSISMLRFLLSSRLIFKRMRCHFTWPCILSIPSINSYRFLLISLGRWQGGTHYKDHSRDSFESDQSTSPSLLAKFYQKLFVAALPSSTLSQGADSKEGVSAFSRFSSGVFRFVARVKALAVVRQINLLSANNHLLQHIENLLTPSMLPLSRSWLATTWFYYQPSLLNQVPINMGNVLLRSISCL